MTTRGLIDVAVPNILFHEVHDVVAMLALQANGTKSFIPSTCTRLDATATLLRSTAAFAVIAATVANMIVDAYPACIFTMVVVWIDAMFHFFACAAYEYVVQSK